MRAAGAQPGRRHGMMREGNAAKVSKRWWFIGSLPACQRQAGRKISFAGREPAATGP
jgi:hypothetical protein